MNKTARKLVSPILFAGLLATPVAASAMDDAEFEKMMEKYLEKEDNLGKIGSALETYFRKQRENQQRAAAEQEKKKMDEQFANPEKIEIGNSPVKGNPDAPITVVEFSDYQCPYCSRAAAVMEDLLKEYPNDVKLVFKNLPLPFHQEAKPAAIAALAAGKQGKFWEFHDELFANQKKISDPLFIEIAKKLDLDMKKFKKDLKDKELAKQVDEDMALATKLGIRGTPGFYVNGVQVRGARPLPYFKNLVEKWKKKMADKK